MYSYRRDSFHVGSAMAFIGTGQALIRQAPRRHVCRTRMAEEPTDPPQIRKLPVTNSPPTPGKKLVRNKPDAQGSGTYADSSAGDMAGGPEVGEGLGPRRGVKEKKVTKAAAIQKSQGFADAWAEQNQGRLDVWFVIGLITLLTPLVILVWAVATGVIPTGGLFEE